MILIIVVICFTTQVAQADTPNSTARNTPFETSGIGLNYSKPPTILQIINKNPPKKQAKKAKPIVKPPAPVIPTPPPAPVLTPTQQLDIQETQDALTHSRGVSATFTPGNDYDWGNCTWYVANRRAVPAGLGNARDWLANAQAMGILIGTTPKVGAVAWQEPGYSLGHVAYVEAVYPDGSFEISEMNVQGLDVIDYRTIANLSDWQFIY